ncbi:MAG: hypothetical protein HFJ13_09325 [Clostridium sp.]|uniref:hypothetical protein n=2 Tax=Clostridium TaxID=1485 RepID=UPI0025C30C28|nr:hypothetical protein [Clostridium sp.]MCI9304299.1 hypothetical protein [Clostridium sp.]
MNSIYKFMLNNKAFDDIIENLINRNKILIIKNDSKLHDFIEYFNDFIINKFDENIFLETIDNIKEEYNDELDIKKIKVLRRQINNDTKNIIKTFSVFNTKNKNYSLNDLYLITDKSIEFKDKEFEYYSILSKSPLFLEDNSLNIILEVDKLIKNNYVNCFIKYNKFQNNKKFKIIKNNIDRKDIDIIINKLSTILNNTFAFIPPIYFNEYTRDFKSGNFYYKNYTNDEINELVKNINYEHNKDIINKAESFKWYKCIGIKKYKDMISNKNMLYEEYNEKEKIIYNQFIENIENLTMFSQSFSFLNRVYKENVLEEINNKIINEDELYNYIKYIKETLVIYRDYLEVEDKIKILNDTQREILNYVYENLSNKNDLKDLLKFIPKYYCYRRIELIENNEGGVINSYNKIYEKIYRLNESLKSYYNILLKVLTGIRNKEINLFINKNNIDLNKLDVDSLINERYSKVNINFLLNLFPIMIIDKKEYMENREKLDEIFDLIVDESDLTNKLYNSRINNKNCSENLDKSIYKMLNNLGYAVFQKEDDISIIYFEPGSFENKIIYLNNNDFFDCNELIKIINLINLGYKIIFVWYRNWWLNKNEEIQRIHKVLNE